MPQSAPRLCGQKTQRWVFLVRTWESSVLSAFIDVDMDRDECPEQLPRCWLLPQVQHLWQSHCDTVSPGPELDKWGDHTRPSAEWLHHPFTRTHAKHFIFFVPWFQNKWLFLFWAEERNKESSIKLLTCLYIKKQTCQYLLRILKLLQKREPYFEGS